MEQEGLNTWGIFGFSQWDLLAQHPKKGFEFGKQRCTAYPRYLVQRSLFDQSLQAYLLVVQGFRFDHPLAVEDATDPLPELDFGPLFHSEKADELQTRFDEAVSDRASNAIAGGEQPALRPHLSAKKALAAVRATAKTLWCQISTNQPLVVLLDRLNLSLFT